MDCVCLLFHTHICSCDKTNFKVSARIACTLGFTSSGNKHNSQTEAHAIARTLGFTSFGNKHNSQTEAYAIARTLGVTSSGNKHNSQTAFDGMITPAIDLANHLPLTLIRVTLHQSRLECSSVDFHYISGRLTAHVLGRHALWSDMFMRKRTHASESRK
ncbi:hypothetical protein J6590_087948 [Homalodisca vitripennis]|nr:hypothetical protein J6590_087948 [Homalodisca vitripennis]